MPNHLHFVILLLGNDNMVEARSPRPKLSVETALLLNEERIVGAGLGLPKNQNKQGGASPVPTLGDIICAFKSKTAVLINKFRRTPGLLVWQRNYYEHIIRNEKSLDKIRTYIRSNPALWEADVENPKNFGQDLNKYYKNIFTS